MQRLPITPAAPNQGFVTSLDGRIFTVGVRWNARGSFWSLSLKDYDTSELVRAGIVLRTGLHLLEGHHAKLPPGFLVVLGTEAGEPTLESLGAAHQVYWLRAEEIDEPTASAVVKTSTPVPVEPLV